MSGQGRGWIPLIYLDHNATAPVVPAAVAGMVHTAPLVA
jgi:hypothetical protein